MQYDGVLTKGGIDMHRGKTMRRHTGRRQPSDWSDASTNQATPRTASKEQKLGKTKEDPALEHQREHGLLVPDFGLLASRPMRW